jgi:GTP-binding protein
MLITILWTLLHLKYQKHVIAGNGEHGGASQSSGKQGEDRILEVPIGTIAKSAEGDQQVAEILKDGDEHVLVAGGRGGLGNVHFKSATQQTPRFAQEGEVGKEEWIILELKILADVGLVGFPNAGKSTLLSVLSAAKPEIANYPFTTLTPNLGMIPYRDHRSFVMADIPGIIEGAHHGKGLGLRFLRHIERNAVLLFLVSADAEDIKKEYDILLTELKAHNPELLDKKRLLAISKSDMLDQELMNEVEKELPEVEAIFISSVAQYNLDKLKDKLWKLINSP